MCYARLGPSSVLVRVLIVQFPTIFGPFDDGDVVCARACSVEFGSGLVWAAQTPEWTFFLGLVLCTTDFFKCHYQCPSPANTAPEVSPEASS